jgi:hypothetical protein
MINESMIHHCEYSSTVVADAEVAAEPNDWLTCPTAELARNVVNLQYFARIYIIPRRARLTGTIADSGVQVERGGNPN